MTPRIVRHVAAKRDVARIACFVAEDSLNAAERFLESSK
jgi:hypothetical protein